MRRVFVFSALLALGSPVWAAVSAEQVAEYLRQQADKLYEEEGGIREKKEIISQLNAYSMLQVAQEAVIAAKSGPANAEQAQEAIWGAEAVATVMRNQLNAEGYYHFRVYWAEALMWASIANKNAGNTKRAVELLHKGLPVARSLTHDSKIREHYLSHAGK